MSDTIDYENSTPSATVRAFFAAPAPRPSPRRMQKLLAGLLGRSAGNNILTGCITVMVVFFTLFWIPFILVFTPWSFFQERALQQGDGERGRLLVTRVEPTNATVNGEKVYRVTAHYPGEDDSRIVENFYTGMKSIPFLEIFDESGQAIPPREVDALISGTDPSMALLPGGRISSFGGVGLLPLFAFGFVLVVDLAVFIWLCRRNKWLRLLLRKGVLTEAVVLDWQETSVMVKGRIQHKVMLGYNTEYGQRESSVVHAEGAMAELYRRYLEDAVRIPAIYVPGRAGSAVFLPSLADWPAASPR